MRICTCVILLLLIASCGPVTITQKPMNELFPQQASPRVQCVNFSPSAPLTPPGCNLTPEQLAQLSAHSSAILAQNPIFNPQTAGGNNSANPNAIIFEQQSSGEYAAHQLGYSDVKVYGSGRIDVWVKFSNGSRFDGDNFQMVLQLLDANNNTVVAIKEGAGVDGSFGGSAREVIRTRTYQVTPNEAARIVNIYPLYYQFNREDDEQNWQYVRQIATFFFAGGT